MKSVFSILFTILSLGLQAQTKPDCLLDAWANKDARSRLFKIREPAACQQWTCVKLASGFVLSFDSTCFSQYLYKSKNSTISELAKMDTLQFTDATSSYLSWRFVSRCLEGKVRCKIVNVDNQQSCKTIMRATYQCTSSSGYVFFSAQEPHYIFHLTLRTWCPSF